LWGRAPESKEQYSRRRRGRLFVHDGPKRATTHRQTHGARRHLRLSPFRQPILSGSTTTRTREFLSDSCTGLFDGFTEAIERSQQSNMSEHVGAREETDIPAARTEASYDAPPDARSETPPPPFSFPTTYPVGTGLFDGFTEAIERSQQSNMSEHVGAREEQGSLRVLVVVLPDRIFSSASGVARMRQHRRRRLTSLLLGPKRATTHRQTHGARRHLRLGCGDARRNRRSNTVDVVAAGSSCTMDQKGIEL
jgi:hypothetical protein